MQLFYREKVNPDNPPLILLHGLWGASDNWLTVAGLLAEHFYVILPDCRNHGNSPHTPEHSYDNLSQDVETFITSLHLQQKPFIAGHSMGGKALMRLLLQKPRLIAKAAILDIAPVSYAGNANTLHQTLMSVIDRLPLQNYRNREEIHTAIRQLLPEEQLCQILFKNLRKTAHGFEWRVNTTAIADNRQMLEGWTIPQIQTLNFPPIHFIRGEKSDYISEDGVSAISALFPGATLETLPEATHFLHQDQPKRLAQALIRFFLFDSGN